MGDGDTEEVGRCVSDCVRGRDGVGDWLAEEDRHWLGDGVAVEVMVGLAECEGDDVGEFVTLNVGVALCVVAALGDCDSVRVPDTLALGVLLKEPVLA